MSNVERIAQTSSNEEALLLAQTDASQAQRIRDIWSWPIIPDQLVPEVIVVPPSLWAAQKASGDSPPLFLVGRRLFVLTADLREWLVGKAKTGKPGSKPLRERAE